MITTVVIGRDQFEDALADAAAVGFDVPLTGLAAPLDAGWMGRISEAWGHVEDALREAYGRGREASRAALETAIASVENLVSSAGARVRDVHQAILERAQAFLDSVVTRALASIRPTVSVGGRDLVVQSIDITQSITMSGSIKATITDLFSLTADGQISVTAQYGA